MPSVEEGVVEASDLDDMIESSSGADTIMSSTSSTRFRSLPDDIMVVAASIAESMVIEALAVAGIVRGGKSSVKDTKLF